MLVDIEVDREEQMLVFQRGDGTCTVSVSVGAFQRAQQLLSQTDGAVIRTAPDAQRAN